MAEQVEIEVVTKADLSEVEELNDLVEQIKENASETIELDSNAEEVASDFDNLGTSADNAASSVDGTSDSLSSIDGSSAQQASQDLDSVGDSASTAAGEVDNLSNSLGVIEAGALMDVANELSNIGSNAEGMAQEMNTAAITVGQLATQTGIAEPQMVSLVNTISNATFPNEEAMMYIKSLDQMGVSAQNLGASATGLDRINDAFHLGAQRTNSLGQELSVLGVDMNNVSSAFDALAYANANTVGGMENYYTFLRRYDSQFKELGFDVDQASIIIAAATQKYGGGRAALSGLSSALKEADGDTRKLEEALGIQAGTLDNASQVTGQYAGQLDALADEEAEHKSILDELGAAWEDISLSLSPVLSPLMGFMGLIGQAGSFAVGINGLIQLGQTFGLLGAAESALIPVQEAEGVAGWFSIGWIALAIALGIALGLAFIYLYENCDWFREGVDNLAATLQWLADAVLTAVTDAVQWLSNQFQAFTSQIGLNTTDWKQAVLGFILFIPQLPLKVGEALVNTIAKALGFGDNFTSTMRNGAMNAVNGFISWIQQIAQRLQEEFDHMLEMASQFALDIADRMSFGGASMVLGWISGSGEHSPGYMYDALMGELSAMVMDSLDLLNQLTGNMFENGAEMGMALLSALEESGIIDLITILIYYMINFQDVVRGVADYILSLGGLLPQSVNLTGNGIIDTILRVMGFVVTLPAQLGMVFVNVIASVLGFGNNFSQRMLSAASGGVSNFISSISRMPSEFASELSSIINQALNFAGQIGQILWNAGVNAITGFLGGLGRHSPGIMQREFRAEIKEMGDAVPEDSRKLISNVSRLGSDIVSAWETPNLNVGFGNAAATGGGIIGGDTIINIYGDVDSDKRVQQIVDAVKQELNWNNVTAGRTV